MGADSADPDGAAEGLRAAAGADVVVAFLGLPPADESEGFDRAHMDLPGAQSGLVTRIAEAAPDTPIVAVLFNGGWGHPIPWGHIAAARLGFAHIWIPPHARAALTTSRGS